MLNNTSFLLFNTSLLNNTSFLLFNRKIENSSKDVGYVGYVWR